MMEVMVSILTTAYNHAPYIAQALDSFVMQKANFKYEVIVHDDASTDNTADIIREYAQKYPDIIRPIFQTENKYSQGIDVYDYIMPLVRGKYIAQCEGDDYWCDEMKLQKQVDYMEAHPECTLCFSNSNEVDINSNVIGSREAVKAGRPFTSREMLEADAGLYATASVMYKTEDMAGFSKDWLAGEVGDFPLRCYMALKGSAYCFAEKMACYRIMVPGSWSMRVAQSKNRAVKVKRAEDMVAFFQRLLQFCNGQYEDIVLTKLNKWEFNERLAKLQWKEIRKPQYRKYFQRLSVWKKAEVFNEYYFPGAARLVSDLRNKRAGRNSSRNPQELQYEYQLRSIVSMLKIDVYSSVYDKDELKKRCTELRGCDHVVQAFECVKEIEMNLQDRLILWLFRKERHEAMLAFITGLRWIKQRMRKAGD